MAKKTQVFAEPDAEPAVKPEDTITIPADTFNQIVERLNTLEQGIHAQTKEESNIFNPLKEEVKEHVCNVAFFYDDDIAREALFIGYDPIKTADGKNRNIFEKRDQFNQLRTYCNLKLYDFETKKEYLKKDVDYILFMTSHTPVRGTIKERKDIGTVVNQDYTVQSIWDGNTLKETGVRVLTGYKSQEFVFKIEVNGQVFDLPQDAVNVR